MEKFISVLQAETLLTGGIMAMDIGKIVIFQMQYINTVGTILNTKYY